jgi:hypothetical protein
VEKLFYTDEKGGMWIGRNVRPGDQVVLERAADEEVHQFFTGKLEFSSPLIKSLIDRQRGRAKYFFAGGPASLAIDTLSTISWEDDDVLFLGPVREVVR